MPLIRCPKCDGKGTIEFTESLTLASLLEPFIEGNVVGFRLRGTEEDKAKVPQLPALEKTEFFGEVVDKIHGVE